MIRVRYKLIEKRAHFLLDINCHGVTTSSPDSLIAMKYLSLYTHARRISGDLGEELPWGSLIVHQR